MFSDTVLTKVWLQNLQAVISAISEFGTAVTAAIEALHPDVLNSEFSS